MKPREMFEAWAPPECTWSPWAKPLLFAQMDKYNLVPPAEPRAPQQVDVSWAPPAGGTAIVLDLPTDESVYIGAALAARGYRPVPLFNTTPGPPPIVVDVFPIMWALQISTETVLKAPLPPNAPPAFMLDSARLRGTGKREPGAYDNRWAVFEQDFPSGTFLLSQRISQVLLMSAQGGLGVDLTRILSAWQRQGLQMLGRAATPSASVEPIRPRKVASWRLAGFIALMALGLRRNSAGGFGSRIPIPSSGGSGGFG